PGHGLRSLRRASGQSRRLPVRPILISAPSQPAEGEEPSQPPQPSQLLQRQHRQSMSQEALKMDDFDLYCRIANSPASMGNSSPLHSPAGSAIAKVDEWIRSLAGHELEAPDLSGPPPGQQQPQQQGASCAWEQPGGCRINRYRSKSHRLRRERHTMLPASSAAAAVAPAASLGDSLRRPRLGSAGGAEAAAAGAAATRLSLATETLVRGAQLQADQARPVHMNSCQSKATPRAVVKGARSSCSLHSSAASSDPELRLHQQQQQQQQQQFLQPIDPRFIGRRPSSADRDHRSASPLPPLPPPARRLRTGPAAARGSAGAPAGCRWSARRASAKRRYEHADVTDGESKERYVTVLLDGDEYHVTFLDTEGPELGVYILDVDAYMVVFAIDNRRSFNAAKQVLNELRQRGSQSLRSDSEAKNLAAVYGAMFMEVSTALHHQVDELLVGTLSQVQARQRRMQKEKEKLLCLERDGGRGLRASLRLRSPRRMVGAFIKKHFSSRSCENLDKETA
uniref:Guanylate cyclase domain-containing protein n=1 Tax=Macrostomum lignano TaxID=282301 RepID=A0A1I8JQK5_9PLAT